MRNKFSQLENEFAFIFSENADVQDLVTREQIPEEEDEEEKQGSEFESQDGRQSKRRRPNPQNYEFHLRNTPITYNYIEEEIKELAKSKNDIMSRIKALKHDLDENTVNLTMINHYKEKHKDFKEKEMTLKMAEEEIN